MNLAYIPATERTRLQALDDAFRALPDRGAIACMDSVASALGYSKSGIIKLWYQWKSGGLVNCQDKRLTPDRVASKATPALVQEYITLSEKYAGKEAPAYRALTAHLLSSGVPERELPSQSALRTAARKVLLAREAEKAVARQGLVAAKAHLPSSLSTRVGLWVGSHLMPDDMWHNFFVRLARGEKKYSIVRPLELGMLDVASGCRPHWGARPRLPKGDGTYEMIQGADVRFFFAAWFATYGYNKERGTTIVQELGTACTGDRLAALLHDRSHGMIKTDDAGIIGNESVVEGMFRGKGTGNSSHKSCLEVLHGLIQNETLSLPGQAGITWDQRPEHTNAVLKYTDELLKLAADLKDDGILQQLALPLLDWHGQLMPFLHRMHERINGRTWHNLEGWTKCGHVVAEYLAEADLAQSAGIGMEETWLGPDAYLELPGHVRAAISMMVKADPYKFTRPAKLSPQAVFNRGRAALTPLPDHVIAEMLTLHGDLTEDWRERPVQAGYIRLWDHTKESGELRYESILHDPEGRKRELPSGSKWLICANPFDLSRAWLFNAKGAFVGTLPRARRVSRAASEHEIHSEQGHVAQRKAVILSGFRDRHQEEGDAAAAMREHNARLLGRTEDLKKPLVPAAPKPQRPRVTASTESQAALLAGMAGAECDEDEEE